MHPFFSTSTRITVAILGPLIACAVPPPQDTRPQGVQIFAEDTVTARVHVRVTGDLQVTLRGDAFEMRPGRTFLVSTPATLMVTRGVGTATITSVDSASRLAVIPIGTPDDSVDAVTVTGTVVTFTRMGWDRRTHRLAAARP